MFFSGPSNSSVSSLNVPEIETLQAFTHVLDISSFDVDSIKKEQASMKTSLSHHKSMGSFSDTQGQLTP